MSVFRKELPIWGMRRQPKTNTPTEQITKISENPSMRISVKFPYTVFKQGFLKLVTLGQQKICR